ncbi:MAG: DUF1015 domain-containing protein [Lachnospiraceae bacterium]|nr:DUF1015 domain-containing protein [Lachnospiraceae bacterium]
MANIKPFRAYRPAKGLEDKIAALPYDVYNRSEAKSVVEKNRLSFLAIDRAETQFPDDVSTYDDKVYDKAREMIIDWIKKGRFIQDEKECYYLYQEEWRGRKQTGIVGCASIDDYQSQIIKKHENTLAAKEQDRINHIDRTGFQTGPIFLSFCSNASIDAFIGKCLKNDPVYDFTSDDEVTHRVWVIDLDDDIAFIRDCFYRMDSIYIADGHHRCASAVKVGLKRREEGISDGNSESDYFMSVLFPDNQLEIMDYNRVLKDKADKTSEQLLDLIGSYCDIEKMNEQYKPSKKGEVSMYMDNTWYKLTFKSEYTSNDAVDGLDVAFLQKYILDGIWGIKDPKTDSRIDFVGGIRGLDELVRRCNEDCEVAFAMYPTSISELFAVANEGRLMPPKSTWFEPKLRSGLFLHDIS